MWSIIALERLPSLSTSIRAPFYLLSQSSMQTPAQPSGTPFDLQPNLRSRFQFTAGRVIIKTRLLSFHYASMAHLVSESSSLLDSSPGFFPPLLQKLFCCSSTFGNPFFSVYFLFNERPSPHVSHYIYTLAHYIV